MTRILRVILPHHDFPKLALLLPLPKPLIHAQLQLPSDACFLTRKCCGSLMRLIEYQQWSRAHPGDIVQNHRAIWTKKWFPPVPQIRRAKRADGRVAGLPCLNAKMIPPVVLKESVHIGHHTGASGRRQHHNFHSRVRLRVRRSPPSASSSFQCADALFTLGTALVLPLYTAMILAPNKPMTKRAAQSPLLYLVLGGLYLYLLAISWTPHHLSLMFASSNWLPELSGITRMFSSPLTVASAWLHLLAVDLYAARHIFLEGLERQIETRHSLVLCLMFGPVGILCHSLTAALRTFLRERGGDRLARASKSLVT